MFRAGRARTLCGHSWRPHGQPFAPFETHPEETSSAFRRFDYNRTAKKAPDVLSGAFTFVLPILEQYPESHRDELRRADVGEDVMKSRFDEGVEATERKHRAETAIQAQLVFRLDVGNVRL